MCITDFSVVQQKLLKGCYENRYQRAKYQQVKQTRQKVNRKRTDGQRCLETTYMLSSRIKCIFSGL